MVDSINASSWMDSIDSIFFLWIRLIRGLLVDFFVFCKDSINSSYFIDSMNSIYSIESINFSYSTESMNSSYSTDSMNSSYSTDSMNSS